MNNVHRTVYIFSNILIHFFLDEIMQKPSTIYSNNEYILQIKSCIFLTFGVNNSC